MAPSPAAGKATKGAPETPTKAGKNPASSATPTLGKSGEQAQDAAQSAQKKTPGKAPKLGPSKATPKGGATDSPKLPPRPKEADKPTEAVKEETPASEAGTEEESDGGKIGMNDNDAEETPGKITQQAGAESSAAGDTDLSEAAPDPVDDDADDEDTVAGAKETAEDEDGEETDTGGAQDTTGAATSAAGGLGDKATDAKDTVEGKAEGAADTVEDTAEDTKATAEDIADDVKDSAEDTAEGATEEAEGATEEAEGAAGDLEAKADETAEGAQETAEGVTDEVPEGEEAVDGVKDTAKDAAEEVEDVIPEVDINILKGLEVGEGGAIMGPDGTQYGQLDEGDPEDLIGQTIGEDGEILDEDGDVIGRCSVLPEKAKELAEKAKEEAEAAEAAEAQKAADEAAGTAEGAVDEAGEATKTEVPDIGILEGLKVGEGGQIFDSEGKAVGKITEGDPEDFIGQEINAEGEVLDEDGDVIGRAEVLPQEVPDITEAAEALKPDLSIIDGKKLNKKGNILDEEGEVIAKLVEGDPKECAGKVPNEKGEILNDKGEVIGKVEVVEGEAADEAMKALHPDLVEAAEKAAEIPPISILEGLKVNKKGEVLNEDGEPIGRLAEGELADVAGKKINEKGEIVDKDGNVIGKVEVLEKAEAAADEAQGAAEEAKVAAEEAKDAVPDFSVLEGLKVNKKGEVVNEDGDVIARLADGFEISDVAGKKINDKGEVLDADGNVIGKVEMIPQEPQEGEEEEAGPELPPLSILEGLKCNKYGKIVDADGNPVGELVEGDPKKLSKMGATCDDQGQFWDVKGKVIGRAVTLAVEDEGEEAPFAGLEGLIVVKDGWVEDENGNRVGQIVEGDPKKLVGRHVDEDGDIIDKRGNVVGRAERYEEPEEEAAPPPDLSILNGLTLNKQGNVIGPEGVPIARLVEGNPKELAGRKVDAEGQIWNDAGKVVGRCELIPENEREAKPEGPFAGLEGVVVVKDGLVEDEEGNVVGRVVEGDPKRLIGRAVDEDGDINDKYGNVIGHCEPYEIPEEEVVQEDLSSLAGKTVNKQGNVVDEHGTIFGRIREGDPKKLAGRKVDGQGQIWSDDGKVIGYAELIPGGEQEKGEGPFSGFDTKVVVQDGLVHDGAGQIIGHVVEGDPKVLLGRHVDDDGDILDKNGNKIGRAERWEPEVKERRINPMSGHKVNKDGEVRDADGNLLGKLTEGDLKQIVGFEVDDNGYVIDNDGNRVGACTLIENLEEEPEGPTEEELAAMRAEEENREIAKKMCGILQSTIERMEPILKQITEVCHRISMHGNSLY
jgi:Protein of unknown function (DUF3659)